MRRRKRGRPGRPVVCTVDPRTFLDGQHWVFLCFATDRLEKFERMFAEWVVESKASVRLAQIQFPPGLLWNRRACVGFFVRKAEWPREALARGLRKHLGYENPEATSEVYTLGVTPEEDEALDRVGLFGKPSN